MNINIHITLFCLISFPGFAIDFYQPGDTLWIWAKKGLNIREQPDVHSGIIDVAENGGHVIMLDYQNRAFPYTTEGIRESVHWITDKEKVDYPGFELTGYWAKVSYKDQVGYVFDAYLSKLRTFMGHQYEQEGKEDFHVRALMQQAKLLKQLSMNDDPDREHMMERFIFDTGHIIEINKGGGYFDKEMLFPGFLSLVEGYLIYANTMRSDSDILLEKGPDFLKFKVDTGFLIIRKVGSFLIISEDHSC